LLAATTIGAGIFSLPYLFKEAGWLTGVFYLVILSGVLISVHYLYWQILAKLKEKQRLLGLTGKYLGRTVFYLGFFVIIGGLLLTLVVYLILIGNFVRLVFPGVSFAQGILVFWFLASLPLVLKLRRLVGFEFLGTVLMAAIIVLVFGSSWQSIGSKGFPAIDLRNFFLPFGAILFSLAGWTAIEPVFEWQKKSESGTPDRHSALSILSFGTLIPAFLYVVFATGILGSAREVTPDTISGLTNWPLWQVAIMGWLGIIAIWTSYAPIAVEIKNSLEKDLRWPACVAEATSARLRPAGLSLYIVLFLPLILIALGLRNFLSIIGLAGGVFLGLQYLLIILVGKKVLDLSRRKNFLLNMLAALFVLGAIFEIYYSLIR